jgi:hypothetical protein
VERKQDKEKRKAESQSGEYLKENKNRKNNLKKNHEIYLSFIVLERKTKIGIIRIFLLRGK